jgi:hypothetical protein
MQMQAGSIVELKAAIEQDLRGRSQSQIDIRAVSNLAECAACALAVKSAKQLRMDDGFSSDLCEKIEGARHQPQVVESADMMYRELRVVTYRRL